MIGTRLAAVALAALLGGVAAAQPAPDYSRGATLQRVAGWPDRQVTGVAVSPTGRVFVNLPRWTQDVPVSVAEVVDGQLRAFPDSKWNSYRNVAPNDPARHFVCVQSVVFDHHGRLWALDPAAPGQEGPVTGGPKLVQIDVAARRVVRVLPFGPEVAPGGSYVNDVRFSPDDRWAYLTDSGARGALVVVDLTSGRARRVLDGDPVTQVDKSVIPVVDGRQLRRPDGRPPQFAADGIALSADGATLYWQALTGRTLYGIPTSALQDPALAPAELAARVKYVATTHPADGLWIGRGPTLYVSNPEHDSVEALTPGGALAPVVSDPRLRWPDSFAQGPQGELYVTSSHIQDSPWFKPDARVTPSEVWRIVPR